MFNNSIKYNRNIVLNILLLLILLFTSFIPSASGITLNQDQLDQQQIIGTIYEDIYDVNQEAALMTSIFRRPDIYVFCAQ